MVCRCNAVNKACKAAQLSSGSPASSRGQINLKVGDDSVEQGLYEGDREAHESGWQHKGPSRKEVVVPLLEEHWQPLNLQESINSAIHSFGLHIFGHQQKKHKTSARQV